MFPIATSVESVLFYPQVEHRTLQFPLDILSGGAAVMGKPLGVGLARWMQHSFSAPILEPLQGVIGSCSGEIT